MRAAIDSAAPRSIRMREQHRRPSRTDAEQQPDRHEELERVVEVVAKRSPGRPRSAISRSDRRMSALKAVWIEPRKTVANANTTRRTGSISRRSRRSRARRRPAVSGYALARLVGGRPSAAAGARARAIRPYRARDRSPEGATGHAGPAPAARPARPWPACRACRRATPARNHDIAEVVIATAGARRRETTGRRSPCPSGGTPVQGPHARVGDERHGDLTARPALGATRGQPAREPWPARDGAPPAASRDARLESRLPATLLGMTCFVGLDDLLHERVPHDVLVVEVDERDALDVADDACMRLDQARDCGRPADRSA